MNLLVRAAQSLLITIVQTLLPLLDFLALDGLTG